MSSARYQFGAPATILPATQPGEHFFKELRKDLSNQVYQDIEAAENHLIEILKPYFHEKEQIIQLTNYSYIRTQ